MRESTTQFVARVTKLSPVVTFCVARNSTRCAMCAGIIRKGETVKPVQDLPTSFTSQPMLSKGPLTCDACARMCNGQLWMKENANAIVTEEGAFPFFKNVDIAYWIANPPRAPYVIVFKTAKIQHVYWTTQMSEPGDCGVLGLGNQNHLIRYPRLLKAWNASLTFSNRLDEQRQGAKTKVEKNALPNPHGLVAGMYDSLHSGSISVHANEDERRLVLSLNPGEIFLLARIQRLSPKDLKRPQPLSLTSKSSKEPS